MRFVVVDCIIAFAAVFVWVAVMNETAKEGQRAAFLAGGFLTLFVFAALWRLILSAQRAKRGE